VASDRGIDGPPSQRRLAAIVLADESGSRSSRPSPLWVISGHRCVYKWCLSCPWKRTLPRGRATSA